MVVLVRVSHVSQLSCSAEVDQPRCLDFFSGKSVIARAFASAGVGARAFDLCRPLCALQIRD